MPTSFSNTNKYEVIARNESDNEWKFREQHNTFIGMLFCLLGVRKYDNVSIFIRNSKNRTLLLSGGYMKKNILISLLSLTMIFALVGCAKCISTEYQNVEVNVVDKYYRGTWIQPIICGKVRTAITHPAVYQIKVEYNNIEYTISDRDTYNKYKDKIEQTAVGTLEINKYDDGTVRYNVISLE